MYGALHDPFVFYLWGEIKIYGNVSPLPQSRKHTGHRRWSEQHLGVRSHSCPSSWLLEEFRVCWERTVVINLR